MANFNTTNDTRNFLTQREYIISDHLQYCLETGKLQDDVSCSRVDSGARDFSNDKYYILMVRVLNKKNNILVYNYISYPRVFFDSFLYFLVSRTESMGNTYREPGHLLTVMDSNLFDVVITDKLMLSKTVLGYTRILENISNSYYSITVPEILRFINRLIVLINSNEMLKLVDSALKKEYEIFIKEVLGHLENFPKFDQHDKSVEPISIINGCLFVVRDLEKFTSSLNGNYNINAGPQSLRGQVNSISNSLSNLDMEYRKSLYNHNNYHVVSGNIDSRFKLSKDKFSFNNIHMNLGGVRWSSTFTPKVKSRDELLQACYKEIYHILQKKNHVVSLTVLQEEIEHLLFEGQSWFSESNKSKNKILYNVATYNYITNSKQTVNNLLRIPDKYSGNTKSYGTEYIPWFKKMLVELGHDKVSDLLIQYFLYVATNESVTIEDVETPGIPSLICYNNFGKRVVYCYVYSRFMKSRKTTLTEFMDSDQEYKKILEDNNFNARIGGFFIYALIESNLIELALDQKSDDLYKYQEYVRLTPNSRKIMKSDEKQTIFHLPSSLPMICPPKEYVYSNDNFLNLGGYLLNGIKYVENIFIKKVGYGKPTVLKDKNIIVDLINGLSRTPYKVNTDTLNFIYKYGVEKDIVIDTNKKEIKDIYNNPYSSKSKKVGKQNRSIISKINLERNVLNIAQIYSNFNEIFFPVRMDNRTRNYCITDYFDYQKNDLAKGLISFSKPGMWYKTDTDVIKYFKGFGANMFGDNLDKKSLNHRVNWVEDNTENILNFENNDMVNKAENKTCFVSFCFEYKRFIDFMNNNESKVFYSYLPIQLDATCNGYQHLSLLTRENNLFDVLNLASSTHDDDPDDFYTYILNLTFAFMKSEKISLSRINDKSDKQLNQISSYDRLLRVVFDRSMVKKTIMTKSYNAGIPTQVAQLITNLDEKYEGNTKYYTYKSNPDVKLKRNDIVVFVMAIKSVIAKESPRIVELSKYLDGIVGICTKLNIPVPWNLPSGAEIMESYEVEKSKPIKAFFFINTRYTFKNYQRGLYDLSKQKRATMPNLIHSLDATTIAMLYNSFKNIGSLYTVHDCFGVTANNVPRLILKLKLVYIQLYSSTGYLREFDEFVKTTINKTRGNGVYKMGDDFVIIPRTGKKLAMPNINSVLNKSIEVECVKQSANLIV